MSIDPIKTTEAITKSYLQYLSTTFYLDQNELRKSFNEELHEPERYVKGPILEATPPFKTGSTLQSLMDEGVLSPSFYQLNRDFFPFSLYEHQEIAIRKIVQDNKNVVVATGTGSGKTEIFLLPILNFLFMQKERGELGPGVRALLLYPMNALANDQLARLRVLLKAYPDITFGRYTGETEEKQQAAIDAFRKMYGQKPLPNELLSRERMRIEPPHILLTNYAMLEYLLLRPQDSVFFHGVHSKFWSFIVLDEAHTYTGAKGIEIAMLIRRLKDQVLKGTSNRLTCIATSATLGNGVFDYPDVAKFATELFGEGFDKEDVIGASRKMIQKTEEWGQPDSSLYIDWQRIIMGIKTEDLCVKELVNIGHKKNIPKEILEYALDESSGLDIGKFLYEVLKGDSNLLTLRKGLEKKPRYLREIASEIFIHTENANELAAALVDLAVKARKSDNDQPLLPARYHVFVRAIEGAYLSLAPDRKVYLARHEKVDYEGINYQVVELAICYNCGAPYIAGEIKENKLVQPKDERKKFRYYLLADSTILKEIDEDEENFIKESESLTDLEKYKLCVKCGTIRKHNILHFECKCSDPIIQELYNVPSIEGKIFTCRICGKFSPYGMINRFFVGTDASASVLTTSLYQQITPNVHKKKKVNKEVLPDVEWSSVKNNTSEDDESSSATRKLLAFSDNRQDAAFFAPYFNRTYMQIIRRNLIISALRECKEDVLLNQWRIQDLVPPLQKKLMELNLFPQISSSQNIVSEIWRWLLYELLGFERRLSLEGMGLLGFSLIKPREWSPPGPLLRAPWNLTEDEVWVLYQVLLESVRKKGALLFPKYVLSSDDFFKPRNHKYYFRGHKAVSKKGIFSWCSSENKINYRLDYLIRLIKKMNINITSKECREILGLLWDNTICPDSEISSFKDYFKSSHQRGEGTLYRLKYNFFQLQPGIIDSRIRWYRCKKCHTLTLYNLKDICLTYRCEGVLEECNPSEVLSNNHYRKLYLETLPLAATAKEHTAQLTSKAAASLQTDFIDGKVNILSCSTTFELGVDVGELETVFMRNVPPSAANYVQRAGRAGRRTDTTAFSLTFAQRRSHDLNHFVDPMRMVAGNIGIPFFKIANEKIVRRHLYAVVLAAFWKENEISLGKWKTFF